MNKQISVNNISFSYSNNNYILRDISFEIAKGEILGIIGKNGSGKSSLIKLLNKSCKPDKGSIFINNMPLAELNAKQRAKLIATVPQEIKSAIPFSPEEIAYFTVQEKYQRFQKITKEDKNHIAELFEFLELSAKKNMPYPKLSGGEKQRTMIAAALVMNPQIILLDEPTSALDFAGKDKFIKLIKQLNKETGLTIIMITHDKECLESVCHSALALKEGRIICHTTPKKILRKTTLQEIFNYQFS